MTPRQIAEYYISPLDPNKFPDMSGITPEQIEDHTQALAKAIAKYCIDFYEQKGGALITCPTTIEFKINNEGEQ